MRFHLSRMALLALLIIGLSAGCISQHSLMAKDYHHAEQNFSAGKYRAAFRQLQAPAKTGNPDAQYALGYLYFYGKVTKINEAEALTWFQSAAENGQHEAIYALKIIDDRQLKNQRQRQG